MPAVKPQAAFFEELGPAGMIVLKDVIEYARNKGLLVIVDGKRNDIGSTATAYATGYLVAPTQSAWGADALTVSPYLGGDSIDPFIEVATQRSAGVFVLVKTSNPGGGMFQDLLVDGRPLYEHVAQAVDRWAGQTLGECGLGSVGGVVGATYPEELARLRATMPRAWLLVPGYGSQGAGASEVAGAFDARRAGGDHQQLAGDHFCPRPQGVRPAVRSRSLARGGRGRHAGDDRRVALGDIGRQPLKKQSRRTPSRGRLGIPIGRVEVGKSCIVGLRSVERQRVA